VASTFILRSPAVARRRGRFTASGENAGIEVLRPRAVEQCLQTAEYLGGVVAPVTSTVVQPRLQRDRRGVPPEVAEVIRDQHESTAEVVILHLNVLGVASGMRAGRHLTGCSRVIAGVDRVAVPPRIGRRTRRSENRTLLGILLEVGPEVEHIGDLHDIDDRAIRPIPQRSSGQTEHPDVLAADKAGLLLS